MIHAVTVAWGRKYRDACATLGESCAQFGITLTALVPKGEPPSPEAAKRLKPKMIADSLEKFGEPVLWLDADCEVVDALKLPSGKFDIAAHKTNVLESAVIYVNTTPRAKALIARWAVRLTGDGWIYDSKELTYAAVDVGAHVVPLPPEMCWTEKYMRHIYPDAKPIILHKAFISGGRP